MFALDSTSEPGWFCASPSPTAPSLCTISCRCWSASQALYMSRIASWHASRPSAPSTSPSKPARSALGRRPQMFLSSASKSSLSGVARKLLGKVRHRCSDPRALPSMEERDRTRERAKASPTCASASSASSSLALRMLRTPFNPTAANSARRPGDPVSSAEWGLVPGLPPGLVWWLVGLSRPSDTWASEPLNTSQVPVISLLSMSRYATSASFVHEWDHSSRRRLVSDAFEHTS
mmetsp:Transcript_43413/g.82825  ORF Transcript_43413/g.82825 Transcript_43413/m.82825 type:complete len:234 (-) Transcript_43413:1361-2062(-)